MLATLMILRAFNPLPAAICLLDPSRCIILLSTDLSSLVHAAKMLIIRLSQPRKIPMVQLNRRLVVVLITVIVKAFQIPIQQNGCQCLSTVNQYSFRFKYSIDIHSTVIRQLNRYLADAADRNATPDALIFWQNRQDVNIQQVSCFGRGRDCRSCVAGVRRTHIFLVWHVLTTGRRTP
jgi:hypothetical protein